MGQRRAHLQMSLFSLPLSVLPAWLAVRELFSFRSSGWCSGSSSRAFLRQMAANSMLATGMAADWPSLPTHKTAAVKQTGGTGRGPGAGGRGPGEALTCTYCSGWTGRPG